MTMYFNQEIDSKLKQLSDKLGGELAKDRPCYPDSLRTFEERRIDWLEDEINKAIIIQPIFTAKGIDSTKWNFINIAWKDDYKVKRKQKIIHLVNEKAFTLIEDNIDHLLKISEVNLKKINSKELK